MLGPLLICCHISIPSLGTGEHGNKEVAVAILISRVLNRVSPRYHCSIDRKDGGEVYEE